MTVSNLTRRKLESEDSSYDSDHEYLAGTLSGEHNRHSHLSHVSKSHDDVTRSYSETLAQVSKQEIILYIEKYFVFYLI